MFQSIHAERILIVGGGIAGLALAAELRRRGWSPEIVERAEAWPTSGAGLYLVGAATRALGVLGLAPAALSEGALVQAQAFHDDHGRRLAEIDVDHYWQGCGSCLGISRVALHRVLAEQAAGLPIRFGASIQAVEQKASCVSITFADGSSGSYDLVIGADGIRSTVRRIALGGGEPRFRGQMGWRFIAQRTSTTRTDAWTVYLGDRSAFLIVPIGHDAVYCYGDRMTRTRAPEEPAEDGRRMRECFGRFAPPVPELVDQLEEAHRPRQTPIEEVSRPAWGRGRVVLIGDAAHAMSPNMACGAAMALEDAIVLGDIIARRGPAADVVPELARRRSARVRWVRRQTNQRDRLRHLPSSVRNFLLRRFAERIYRTQYQPLLAPM